MCDPPQLRAAGSTDALFPHALVTPIGDGDQPHDGADLSAVLKRPRAEQLRAEHGRTGFGHAAHRAELPRDRRHAVGARLDLGIAAAVSATIRALLMATRCAHSRSSRSRNPIGSARPSPVCAEARRATNVASNASRMPCVASNAWIRLRTHFRSSRTVAISRVTCRCASASGEGTCTTRQTCRSPPSPRRSSANNLLV